MASGGVARLVDAFIANIGADDQMFHCFAKADVSPFRAGFITHLWAIADSTCHYDGDTVVDIHTGMHITATGFNRIVELLIAAMASRGTPYATRNQVLARLPPLRS